MCNRIPTFGIVSTLNSDSVTESSRSIGIVSGIARPSPGAAQPALLPDAHPFRQCFQVRLRFGDKDVAIGRSGWRSLLLSICEWEHLGEKLLFLRKRTIIEKHIHTFELAKREPLVLNFVQTLVHLRTLDVLGVL